MKEETLLAEHHLSTGESAGTLSKIILAINGNLSIDD